VGEGEGSSEDAEALHALISASANGIYDIYFKRVYSYLFSC